MKYIPIFNLSQISYYKILKSIEKKGTPVEILMPADSTVRIIVPVSISGVSVRLHFENVDPDCEGLIECVTIAKCDSSGTIDPMTVKEVMFHRETSYKLAPKDSVVSDAVSCCLKAGDYLAISSYNKESQFTGNSIVTLLAPRVRGNHCYENFKEEEIILPQEIEGFPSATKIPYLSRLDILTDSTPYITACLGDSITCEGFWYRPLMEKLYNRYPEKVVLLNYGICGNRMVYNTAACMEGIFGDAAVKRFEGEVLSTPGITHLVLSIGVNDLMHWQTLGEEAPPTADEFGECCQKIAALSREKGIKTMALTMCPALLGSTPEVAEDMNKLSKEYDDKIKNAGFDHVMDASVILGVEGHHAYKEGYCREDNLHLSEKGGRELADHFDEGFFVER